jgi:hypothetical protein
MRKQIVTNAWHALCLTPENSPELVMSVSFPSGFATLSPTPSVSPSKSGNAAASLAKPAETAAQKFLDYANMTPAERLQADMLNQLGITQDQFKAMSPAEQQKIMDKIREMIKQQVQNGSDKRTGLITDISA